MRWLTLPCLVLAACSALADDAPQREVPAPVIASSTADLRKAAEEEKLVAPLEVAGPLAANLTQFRPPPGSFACEANHP